MRYLAQAKTYIIKLSTNETLSAVNLTFLGTVEECSVLGCVSDLDDLSTCQQLHDQRGSDDGRDTQLHQRTCTSHTSVSMQHNKTKFSSEDEVRLSTWMGH